MAYNYAREKRKFDAEWKRMALWYRKEGSCQEFFANWYAGSGMNEVSRQ